MPSKTDAPVEDQWEDINVGLGISHDPETQGPLTGIYLETQNVTGIKDEQNGGDRENAAHIFNVDGQRKFIWGSYNLDQAMKEVNQNDTVRVTFDGRNNFTGDRGPQQIKLYRVQVRKN